MYAIMMNSAAVNFLHKRNEEEDQRGPWTPLEGPKVEYGRSQDLPDYSFIQATKLLKLSCFMYFETQREELDTFFKSFCQILN